MDGQTPRPVIFVGPSISRDLVLDAMPHARIESPIGRGDLARLRQEGTQEFLIIDGVFGQELAVAPSEIVAVLRDGAHICGAASLGAIRAAECFPAGMKGVGAVYRLYRLRVLCNDDEVAVAVAPTLGYTAVSVALVDVRFTLLTALRGGMLSRDRARAVLTAAKQMHFSERQWDTIFRSADVELSPAIRQICESTDVKRRDAARAVQSFACVASAGTNSAARGGLRHSGSLARYPGHDPKLGHSAERLNTSVARWLLGSGRYRRYFSGLDAADGALSVINDVWARLAATDAWQSELMRWYAIERGRALASDQLPAQTIRQAEEEIAEQHGSALGTPSSQVRVAAKWEPFRSRGSRMHVAPRRWRAAGSPA